MVHHRRVIRKEVRVPERMQLFMDGTLTVDDLDEEEIMRGQLRTSVGDFRGRPADMVPRVFLDAVRIKRQQIWNEQLEQSVQNAWATIRELSNGYRDMTPADNVRFNAAKFIIERAQGKTPDNINIKAEVATWEKNLENSIVDVDWSDVGDDTKEIEQ